MSSPHSKPHPLRRAQWSALVLLLLVFAQTVYGAVISSITFDEGTYLTAGYILLRTKSLRYQIDIGHPLLVNIISALPLLLDPDLPDPRSLAGWSSDHQQSLQDEFIWHRQSPD